MSSGNQQIGKFRIDGDDAGIPAHFLGKNVAIVSPLGYAGQPVILFHFRDPHWTQKSLPSFWRKSEFRQSGETWDWALSPAPDFYAGFAGATTETDNCSASVAIRVFSPLVTAWLHARATIHRGGPPNVGQSQETRGSSLPVVSY